MASYICETCAVGFPMELEYRYCLVCGTDLSPPVGEAPDEDWEERMAKARDAYDNPPEDDEEYPKLKEAVMIYREHGVLWVNSHDLIRAGMAAAPQSFNRVEFPDGTVIEFQGLDDAHRRWWVDIITKPSANQMTDEEMPDDPTKPKLTWPKFG